MPQLFQVLRCFKCYTFQQVHQTKKSNKFQCKVCGEKQSIKRHYGIGTAKDCRTHVQKLNGIRGEIDENAEYKLTDEEIDSECDNKTNMDNTCQILKSKWSEYLEKEEVPVKDDNETMLLENTEVVLEVPKKLRKYSRNNIKFAPPDIRKVDKLPTCEVEDSIYEDLCQDDENRHICTPTISNNQLQQKSFILDNSFREKKEEKHTNKFIPQSMNKNSKWAQYTEDSEDESIKNPPVITEKNHSKSNNALSYLFEDSDSEILDISL